MTRYAPTFVQPFVLEVIMICGAKRLVPPSYSFHFSRSGRNAKVSQNGPTAFVSRELMKSSSETVSKYAARNASAVFAVSSVNALAASLSINR